MDFRLPGNPANNYDESSLALVPKAETDVAKFLKPGPSRTKYSEEEDMALERFVSEHTDLKIAGNVLWREAARQGVTSHSWQSMRDRYLKRLLPRMRQRQSRGVEAPLALPAPTSSSSGSPIPSAVPVAVAVARQERPAKRQRASRVVLPPLEPKAQDDADAASSGSSVPPAQLAPAQLMLPPGFLNLPHGNLPGAAFESQPARMVSCRVCCRVHAEPESLAELQIGCGPCRQHFHAMCLLTHWLRRWREDPHTSPCCPVCGTMVTARWQWSALLRAAIRTGDEATFDAVLSKGSPDLAHRCPMGMTLLHYCAANGTPAMILALIQRMPWALTATDAAGRTAFDLCPCPDPSIKRSLLPLPHLSPLGPPPGPPELFPGLSAARVLSTYGLAGLLALIWGDLPRIDRHMGVETLLAAAFEGDWAEVLDVLHALGIPLDTFRKPCCDHCRSFKATPLEAARELGRPRIAARLRELAALPTA
eukprot:tig00021281_g19914.t1